MEPDKSTYVFVYGTLKPGCRNHKAYCDGLNFEAREATTDGKLFHFPELSYPAAKETSDSIIRGFLLIFRHSEIQLLSKLDELEGYDPNRPSSENAYYRKRVQVHDAEGEEVPNKAWCYFMDPRKIEQLGGVLIPDGTWAI